MNDCHMSCGLKNVCLTSAAPGASRTAATSAASTTTVLTVDTVAAPRLRTASSLGPRPVVTKVFVPAGSAPLMSRLEAGNAGVDLQPLLRELVQRAVGLHLRYRLVDAGGQRVALLEDHPEVLEIGRASCREIVVIVAHCTSIVK